MKKIYLDYASSAPVDEQVFEVMKPYFSEKYGNPGSLHSFGQEAIAAMDKSRETIAKAIGARFNEVIFIGSATEANNLALRGVGRGKIIVSAIEHESVLDTARDLEKEGVEVVILSVNKEGFVDLEELKNALDERTALVSVMYANNEIGTIQPISAIAEVISNWKLEISKKNQLPITNYQFPLFHTDAVQAFQFLDCNVNKLGVDLMTLSAHKIYGPKGIGALYVRAPNSSGYNLNPIITGGGQEFGLRSGTENVPNIVGFAKAVELVNHSRELESRRIGDLRDYFWNELKKIYPSCESNPQEVALGLNLGQNLGQQKFLPNILNVYFPRHKAEDLLIKFDMAGIAASSGSACRARSPEPSHVLQALGLPLERVRSSIRFSFGRFTTREEIEEVLRRISKIL